MEETVIWGDVLFLIDFSMDFLCLYFALRILGIPRYGKKLIFAAAFGASFDVISLMLPGRRSVLTILTVLCAAVMCISVLPKNHIRSAALIKVLILTVFLEASVSGILAIVYYRAGAVFRSFGIYGDRGLRLRLFWAVLFCVSCILIFLLVRQKRKSHTCMIHVEYHGRSIDIEGFFDSGNTASEPISGLPVTVLPTEAALKLSLSLSDLENGKIPKTRLIPFNTVNGSGMKWGFLPEKSVISEENGKTKEFYSYFIIWECEKSKYEAILPSVLMGT